VEFTTDNLRAMTFFALMSRCCFGLRLPPRKANAPVPLWTRAISCVDKGHRRVKIRRAFKRNALFQLTPAVRGGNVIGRIGAVMYSA
jgi:hypothetical protein